MITWTDVANLRTLADRMAEHVPISDPETLTQTEAQDSLEDLRRLLRDRAVERPRPEELLWALAPILKEARKGELILAAPFHETAQRLTQMVEEL